MSRSGNGAGGTNAMNISAANAAGAGTPKRKRRPAGTPDPDAEVVSLSPRTLLESDRYVCEICNQGFQRDQNLQMHRRRHKVPWKLLKKEPPQQHGGTAARKRVYVCPEPSCLHHDPGHALGDLVGIKKHFRRKHSSHRQWACAKCSKAYAVQSDYKAHLKTCGTRGHSCDCGRVFSRVESFIEHQDTCAAGGRARPEGNLPVSSPSPSSDVVLSPTWPTLAELQLLPACKTSGAAGTTTQAADDVVVLPAEASLDLSIGFRCDLAAASAMPKVEAVMGDAQEQLCLALSEKAKAQAARREARWQVEMAEQELANAKRVRQQAQAEMSKAAALREQAMKQLSSALLEVTCVACRTRIYCCPAGATGQDSHAGISWIRPPPPPPGR